MAAMRSRRPLRVRGVSGVVASTAKVVSLPGSARGVMVTPWAACGRPTATCWSASTVAHALDLGLSFRLGRGVVPGPAGRHSCRAFLFGRGWVA